MSNQLDWLSKCSLDDSRQTLEPELLLVLDAMGLKGVSLSVVTTNDADVEALNGRWRGKDTATDVLSFPQIAREDELLPGITLGDIVVSLETFG